MDERKKFYDTMMFIGAMAFAGFLLGYFIGGTGSTLNQWEKNRMFDRCLEWKKNYDLCKKEVYGE